MIFATRWLRSYDRHWFRPDLAAGVTLAAYLLPSALGDASLAGLPSEAGIYACLFGGLVWWLFCSSRQTAISVTSAISLLIGSHGVKLLGEVPRGLPVPSLPAVHYPDIRQLMPLALACFLLGAVETAAIGRMFAEKHGYRIDSNRELLGLAGANIASGLGHGFPISGGMSQSLVNESGGARTPLSGLIATRLMLVVALFFTDLLRNLPQPVLAAVVLMAVASLVKVKALKRLWQFHRGEFIVAMAALAGVLWAGLLQGVLLGAIISMVRLIRRASTPHVAFLGRIPGAQRYSDLERHADNEPIPGVLAFRVESPIVYFNAEHVFDAVLARLDTTHEAVRMVICDLSTSPNIDMAGARMFLTLHAECEKRGVAFRLVEARSKVRDMLRTEGVEEKVGRIDRFTMLADAIDAFQKEAAAN